MANNYDNNEQEVVKKYARKDKQKRQKMPVTGKSVFELQRLMAKNPSKKGQK